ncbi:MAG: DNA translocase FtsK 4TM domain-containing protein, partial [Pseudolabrys sp.]
MRAADRSLDIIAFVSEHFRDIIRRRLSELAGLALISLALLGAIALATWSIQDPSLSHATQKPIHNLLGFPGAIFSDLAMQLLGLASILLLVPEVLLGWRLVSHRPMGEKWRSLLWIVATFLAAAFASALPHIVSWPLPTGLGGVAGDAVLRVPAWIFGSPLGGFTRFILCILFGLATVVTLLLAARIPDRAKKSAAREVDSDEVERDEADGDHASAWLGMIVHALLSWKARIGRMIRGDVRARTPMPVAQSPRHEPRFDGEDSEYEDGEEDDEEAPAPRRRAAARAPSRRGTNGYTLPSLNLLAAQRASERTTLSRDIIDGNATALESVLQDFGVRGEIINARPGPVVTLYELEPAPGIKSSRVIGLADDIARSMSAVSARVAVVSGRNAIGIELPNPVREKVYLRELLTGMDYNESAAKLPLCLGKTIGGESVIVDLSRMPHLLIAGTTGSGKSVAINTMILSLVYRLRPDQCRLIMVDPKMLELSVYDGIPHLLTPVVTDPKKAVVALKWAVREMEGRYKKMSKLGVRNIDGYNARVA